MPNDYQHDTLELTDSPIHKFQIKSHHWIKATILLLQAYVACASGIYMVGWNTCITCGFSAVVSLCAGWIVKQTGRMPLFTFGLCLCNLYSSSKLFMKVSLWYYKDHAEFELRETHTKIFKTYIVVRNRRYGKHVKMCAFLHTYLDTYINTSNPIPNNIFIYYLT